MKVLVTGAGGFLGGALVERLLAHGEKDLRLFVRPSSRREKLDLLMARFPDARVEICVGDLDELDDARRAVQGAGLVYHLVAAGRGGAAEIFQATVVTSQNLLDALLEVPPAERPRVVLVSSFSVYGAAALGRGALIDEGSPVEPHPARRDVYAQAKLRQEKLFWEARAEHGLSVVVVRPGVIYGPGGTAISPRVGMQLSGVFLHLGGDNVLPLTYVDNCAEGVVVAGRAAAADGQVYNLVDDDLPTCDDFLRAYRERVQRLRALRLPYPLTMALSLGLEQFNRLSPRKLPPVLTPYRTATSWAGHRFTNRKIKALGFAPLVSTSEGLARTFATLSR